MRLGDLDEALRMIKTSKIDCPFDSAPPMFAWQQAHDCAISCVEACNTIDAVPVVRCRECVLSGNCSAEDTFRLVAGIDDPYCCVGKTKESKGK